MAGTARPPATAPMLSYEECGSAADWLVVAWPER